MPCGRRVSKGRWNRKACWRALGVRRPAELRSAAQQKAPCGGSRAHVSFDLFPECEVVITATTTEFLKVEKGEINTLKIPLNLNQSTQVLRDRRHCHDRRFRGAQLSGR